MSEPFPDAQTAWFWTVRALAVRQGRPVAVKVQEPSRRCDADDIIKALDLLYRRGGIGPNHARVLRRWGERGTAPPSSSKDDAQLWTEAMNQLESLLRPKGFVA